MAFTPKAQIQRATSVSIVAILSVMAATGCSSSTEFSVNSCRNAETTHCVEIAGGDTDALLAAVNSLESDTTIVLGLGTYELENQVTIRNASSIYLMGQGMDSTKLSFANATTQINGIDVIADDFLVQDLTVEEAPKDGIRVENSDGVVFRRIRATWIQESASTNGAYGIYPVKCRNVLVEDSEAFNASDAGLYVGQCVNAVVRRNLVSGNVAGLEIENTQYADVYENIAEDNTCGIVAFDLPGNPVVGRDIHFHDNTIRNNNRRNFAPGGTVAIIPAGLATFVLATRRVVIEDNVYENNNSLDIGLASGLILESDPTQWELATADLIGDWEDLSLPQGATAGTIMNFRSEDIVVRNNTHSRDFVRHDGLSGDIGGLLAAIYGTESGDAVLYDGIGESSFDANDVNNTSNDNNICVGGNDNTFININAESQINAPPAEPVLRLTADNLGPYDCDSFTPALVTVEL